MTTWRDMNVHVAGPFPRLGVPEVFEVRTENYRTEVSDGPLWRWRVERAIRRLCKAQFRYERRVAQVRGEV